MCWKEESEKFTKDQGQPTRCKFYSAAQKAFLESQIGGDLRWNRVWFSRELRECMNQVLLYERIYRFNSKVRKREKYTISKWILRNIFCCCSYLSIASLVGREEIRSPLKTPAGEANLSNDDVISQRPGLKTGVKNDIFWSEIDLCHTAAILSNFVYAGLASFSLRGQPYINKVF